MISLGRERDLEPQPLLFRMTFQVGDALVDAGREPADGRTELDGRCLEHVDGVGEHDAQHMPFIVRGGSVGDGHRSMVARRPVATGGSGPGIGPGDRPAAGLAGSR